MFIIIQIILFVVLLLILRLLVGLTNKNFYKPIQNYSFVVFEDDSISVLILKNSVWDTLEKHGMGLFQKKFSQFYFFKDGEICVLENDGSVYLATKEEILDIIPELGVGFFDINNSLITIKLKLYIKKYLKK